MKLQILFLVALPLLVVAEFTIQGPSDGNRRAQGLKYSKDKGIEYSDIKESLGAGDFSIQGASDGHSQADPHANFKIQGATDGHSDFQIQGASGGDSQGFTIQGPSDSGVAYVQPGAYQRGVDDTGRDNSGKALNYQDPSGLRVNWRSFRDPRPAPAQQPVQQHQQQQQYHVAQQQPIAPRARQQPQRPIHRSRVHQLPAQAPQGQQQPQQVHAFGNAPDRIKQLLQLQSSLPYTNIIPEHYRVDENALVEAQRQHVQTYIQNEVRNTEIQPQFERRYPNQFQNKQPRAQQQQQQQQPASRQKRQAPQYPQLIQDLLKLQAQIPYDITANQITYRPDKPYVPEPVQPQQPQQTQQQYQNPQPQQYQNPQPQQYQNPQPQQYQNPQPQQYPQQYQNQVAADPQYQSEALEQAIKLDQQSGQQGYDTQAYGQIAYNQAPEQLAYNQLQHAYSQGDDVKPVTENEY